MQFILHIKFFLVSLCILVTVILSGLSLYAHVQNLEELNYSLRKIVNPPLHKAVTKNFDLYELYLENNSDKAFSIPGYSINLGVDYSGFSDVLSAAKDKSSKKLAVLNIAAGAASLALGGGIVRSATSTAIMSIGIFNRKIFSLSDDKYVISPNKTYIVYPHSDLVLYAFINKQLNQVPSAVKFICKDEEHNLTWVVVNNNIEIQEIDFNPNEKNSDENVIAAPSGNDYH